jgi:flagellar hook-length control protein FliK
LLSNEKPASSQTRDVLTELKKLETNNVHTTAFVKESSVQHASTISVQTPAAILKETMENALPKKTTIANKKHNEVAIEPTTLNATEKNEIKFSETVKPVETKLVNESKIVSENISKNFEQKKNSDTNIATSLNPENATEKQLSSTSGKTIVDEPIYSGKESTQPKHSQQNFVRNDGGEVSNRMQDVGTQRNEIQPRYSNALSHEWAKHVIEDVSKSAMIKVTEQLSEIRLRLHPEHLGELVLSVKSEGEKMSANILVNSFEVKRALETNMPVLHDALMLRGIEMKKIDVNENTNAQQQFRHNNDEQTGHQNRQQRPYDEERAKQFARYFGYNTMEYTV